MLCILLACGPGFAAEKPPSPFHQTPLVTGNGFGFAVVSAETGAVTAFYTHPYKFTKPDPKNPLSEGIETTNLIKSLDMFTPNPVPSHQTSIVYLDESQIVSVKRPAGTESFFMPFNCEQNVLVAVCNPDGKATAGTPPYITWQHEIKRKTIEHISGKSIEVVAFADIPEYAAVIPLDDKSVAIVPIDRQENLVPSIKSVLAWQNGSDSRDLLVRELDEVDEWRAQIPVTFHDDAERDLWRQSEIVLRMAQSREPNNEHRFSHGMIVASLPDGAWFVPWVRDMAYATLALIRMDHQQEARWALQAYLNAHPVGAMKQDTGGLPYQVSVARYFGDGSEEPFFTMEGATNIEFDDWGLVLYALGTYMQHFRDWDFLETPTYRGTVYENAKQFIVTPLLDNLQPYEDGLIVKPDTSIWEERQNDRKHFAYSTAAALAGLKAFKQISLHAGDLDFADRLQDKIDMLQRGFNKAFTSSGRLIGTLEPNIKNNIDGATLNAITLGATDDHDLMDNTAAAMERYKMPSGGYKRVHSIAEDPKIYEYWYERQEFVFTDFALAEVLLRLDQLARANEIVEPIVSKAANDHNFIPEMYVSEVNYRFTGPIGAPTGAIPMVGYGAGAFVNYLLQRQAHIGKQSQQ